MQRADLTTRAVAGFVDLLIIIGLARLPDVLGFLFATGYILIRDGLFDRQKHREKADRTPRNGVGRQRDRQVTYRESIIRNVPFAVAYLLFLIPYAGWVLGPAGRGLECLTAIGDERGMRIGDLLARTIVIPDAPAPCGASGRPGRRTGAAARSPDSRRSRTTQDRRRAACLEVRALFAAFTHFRG